MFQKTLNATAKVSLGIAHPDIAGSTSFQIYTPSAASYSAVPKIRMGGQLTNTDGSSGSVPDAALKSVRYWNMGTSTLVAAGTAITADGVFVVNLPAGVELVLDNTYTSGDARVYATPGEQSFPAA